jgi:hypothetical protein
MTSVTALSQTLVQKSSIVGLSLYFQEGPVCRDGSSYEALPCCVAKHYGVVFA